jgi:hypothetical protein
MNVSEDTVLRRIFRNERKGEGDRRVETITRGFL